MICSITVERLNGQSDDKWLKSWHRTVWPLEVVRAMVLRGVDDPAEVVRIVFADGDCASPDLAARVYDVVDDIRIRERRDGMAAFRAGVI